MNNHGDFSFIPITMSDYTYDLVVIGGGSGGYAAARSAHSHGLKTAVIDGADELGGLCILRGCMPSKTLIESANRARIIRDAKSFGLTATYDGADATAIRARKRALIGDFAGYRQGQLEDGRFDLHRGYAKFTSPHSLEVSLRDGSLITVTFRSAIIAAGSTISIPPIDGLQQTGFLTSDDVLDSDSIPKSIIVLGGGAIAMELAHYYEGLGVKTTVIQRSPHILKSCDPDVAQVVEEASRERGIDLFTGTKITSVTRDEDGLKRVHFDSRHGPQFAAAEEILCALGRKPNTKPLNLEAAGIHTTPSGHIAVEPTQACVGQPHLFAVGDICGPLEVVHLAIEQGEIAADNAHAMLSGSAGEPRTFSDRLKLFGVFTEPQIGMVGLTEKEAQSANIPYDAASYPFNDHGKSMVMGELHGFVKLLAHRDTQQIIGGAAVGPHASELIHEVVVAMRFHATAEQLATTPHYHPTLSEIWTYPAEDLADL